MTDLQGAHWDGQPTDNVALDRVGYHASADASEDRPEHVVGQVDRLAGIKTIRAALELGITPIDTAPVYGFGRAEHLVGRAIAEHGGRERVLMATKAGLDWRGGAVHRNASAGGGGCHGGGGGHGR
jgi:aryl-alcohol dehydrogenase-like predicted oxidoreductase